MKGLRIANAQGFWGDDPEAAKNLMLQDKDIDFINLDYLAELSLSIMAIQKKEGKGNGYAADFLEALVSLVPFWNEGRKFKVVTNAGGLNPLGCLEACIEKLKPLLKLSLKIACLTGDDVFHEISQAPKDSFTNLDTGKSIGAVQDKLLFANAYIGAFEMADAIKKADIIIAGRATDPSLTLAPCIAHFNWKKEDYQKLAGGTLAGHVIECGTQATGGFSTDWLNVPHPEKMGFPIAEIKENGDFIITKAKSTGGAVTVEIIKEQLLYEIDNPYAYQSPDVIVSLKNLRVEKMGLNKVAVYDALGIAPGDKYKVNAGYFDGYRIEASLTINGKDAYIKAKKVSEIILSHLKHKKIGFKESFVEYIGADPFFCKDPKNLGQITLRIALKTETEKEAKRFSKEIAPLITSGPQGIVGYASGRAKPRPIYAFWPTLIEKNKVHLKTHIREV